MATTLTKKRGSASVKKIIRNNHPSASRVFTSLRNVGYKIQNTIGDLVDNSIDGKASSIWVEVDKDPKSKEYIIRVIDDGNGMDERELDEALRLGSEEVEYDDASLGKFGFGLITASIAVCRRLEVLTRSSDEVLFSAHDLDAIDRENAFIKEGPEKASPGANKELDKYCGERESGTIVTLKKCDLVKDQDVNRLTGTIRKYLGQVYRIWLRREQPLHIYLNGELVRPTDVLLEKKGSELFSDDEYPIRLKTDDGETEVIVRCRLAIMPYEGKEVSKQLGITHDAQGFSIFRNFREICDGQTLSMFTRHTLLRNFRGEVFLPSAMDDHAGINFSKMSLNLDKNVLDQLHHHLQPQVRAIRRKIQRLMQESAAEKKLTDFSKVEQYIRQRAAVLIKPKSEVEKRKKGDSNGEKKQNGKRKTKSFSKKNLTKKDLRKSLEAICEFKPVPLGRSGPIYEATPKGKFLFIEINQDHPFYDRFVLGTHESNNIDLYNATGFLLYAMASAERIVMDDDVESVLHTWKSIMAANLSNLLST
tara:strand:- start:2047 stop:3648 length:1602 start_codon:yes stop_codon:yes gene_type:complete